MRQPRRERLTVYDVKQVGEEVHIQLQTGTRRFPEIQKRPVNRAWWVQVGSTVEGILSFDGINLKSVDWSTWRSAGSI